MSFVGGGKISAQKASTITPWHKKGKQKVAYKNGVELANSGA